MPKQIWKGRRRVSDLPHYLRRRMSCLRTMAASPSPATRVRAEQEAEALADTDDLAHDLALGVLDQEEEGLF